MSFAALHYKNSLGMSEEEEKEKIIKQAQTKAQILRSKLRRKINELKALKHSTEDAMARWQATEKEYHMLKCQLETLASLTQEYEASVHAFNANYEEKSDDAMTVDDSLIKASSDIQVNVDIIVQKVKKQLAGENEEDSNYQTDGSGSESDTWTNLSLSKPIPIVDKAEEERASSSSMKLTIFICLLIVIINYVSLALIIDFAEGQKIAKRAKGKEHYEFSMIK